AERAMVSIDTILEWIHLEITDYEVEEVDLVEVFNRITQNTPLPRLKLKFTSTLPLVRTNRVEVAHVVERLISGFSNSIDAPIILSAEIEGDSLVVSLGHPGKGGKRLSIEEFAAQKVDLNLNSLDLLLCNRIVERQSGKLWVTI